MFLKRSYATRFYESEKDNGCIEQFRACFTREIESSDAPQEKHFTFPVPYISDVFSSQESEEEKGDETEDIEPALSSSVAEQAEAETEQISSLTPVFEPEKERDVLISPPASSIHEEKQEGYEKSTEETQHPSVSVDKEDDNIYSVHLYQGPYESFSALYDGTDEKIKRAMEKQGISIDAFLSNSRNDIRVPVNKDEMIERIRRGQRSWRWTR